MMQWFEKIFEKEDPFKVYDDSLPALEVAFSQLKGQVLQLTNQLKQGKFQQTQLGIEAIHSLNELYDRLYPNQNNPDYLNTERLRQETQNFESFWKIYTLEINTQIGVLRKNLSQKHPHEFYSKEIVRVLSKINKLQKDVNEIEFPDLCNQFGALSHICEKLLLKIKEAGKAPEKNLQKIAVTSFNSKQQEKIRQKEEAAARLQKKLSEFRKSVDFLIAHIEDSSFKTTTFGTDTLSVLKGLKNRLLDENINLATLDESALEQEKQGLQNYLTLESKEIKKQLNEFIQKLKTNARGFHTVEIDQWIKEADSLIHHEGIRFPFLCDGYTKLYSTYVALNLKISESAQQAYSTYLKKIAALQIGIKCQMVKNSSFLAEYEKEQILRLVESVQAEFKLITLDNIQASDVEKRVALTNFEEAYENLLGKGSLAEKRKQFCARFQASLDRECHILTEDSKALLTLCLKQNLLAGGEIVLSNLQTGNSPHPLVKLFQAIRQVDVSSHNLQQCCKAYEKFVRQNPLNPLHSKKGIALSANLYWIYVLS